MLKAKYCSAINQFFEVCSHCKIFAIALNAANSVESLCAKHRCADRSLCSKIVRWKQYYTYGRTGRMGIGCTIMLTKKDETSWDDCTEFIGLFSYVYDFLQL